MGNVIDERRRRTLDKLDTFKQILGNEAEAVIAEKACVYVTGSGGRGEMSDHSDLDLFIVSDVEAAQERPRRESVKPKLSRLDAIIAKAHLIRAVRAPELNFPDFSKDGRYLEMHTTDELCENLGRPEDDHANTFTARLLLLLESTPLLGKSTYDRVIDEVIAAYWEDYQDHQDCFRPVFLINDIVRMWKTFCVNYEAFTERQPDEKRAKRRLTNYKLKHSRVLTCYSAVLYLMQIFEDRQTVTPDDARAMVKLTPTKRLEWLTEQRSFVHSDAVTDVLCAYERFLESTNCSESDLIAIFADRDRRQGFIRETRSVGELIAELLQKMSRNGLFRFLIV